MKWLAAGQAGQHVGGGHLAQFGLEALLPGDVAEDDDHLRHPAVGVADRSAVGLHETDAAVLQHEAELGALADAGLDGPAEDDPDALAVPGVDLGEGVAAFADVALAEQRAAFMEPVLGVTLAAAQSSIAQLALDPRAEPDQADGKIEVGLRGNDDEGHAGAQFLRDSQCRGGGTAGNGRAAKDDIAIRAGQRGAHRLGRTHSGGRNDKTLAAQSLQQAPGVGRRRFDDQQTQLWFHGPPQRPDHVRARHPSLNCGKRPSAKNLEDFYMFPAIFVSSAAGNRPTGPEAQPPRRAFFEGQGQRPPNETVTERQALTNSRDSCRMFAAVKRSLGPDSETAP